MNKFSITLVAILASLAATHAPRVWAQSCEAYFPFDGSLADASGNGSDGRMIGQEGAAATPRFVEGRSGQALAFDGTATMRAFLDLNYESCPQVSFAAWIRFDGPVLRENQVILATGGSGPGLSAVGSVLALNGTENGLSVREAVHADSGWMFVAGVYDYAENTYVLHWRNRSVEGTLSQHRRLPEDAIWVGAMNDNLTHPASNIVIDELRIVGRALDADAIMAMRDGRAAAGPAQSAIAGAAGAACVASDGCPANTYCAMDGTCHPDSHRPMARGATVGAAESPLPAAGTPLPGGLASDTEGLQRRIEEHRPMDFGSEAESTTGSREIVTADVRDSLQGRVEERGPIEFGYASEEEGAAAAEAAAERRRAEEEAEAEATSEGSFGGSIQGSLVVPRPTGPPRFSAISGTSGDTQRILDMESEFLTGIFWREAGDVPCGMQVRGGDTRENWRSINVGCPASLTNVLSTGWVSVSLQSSVISSVQVCQRNSNQRLKGIRVAGDRVNADGTVEYVPGAADQESMPNCQSWSPIVLCPSQHVATGVVVHAQERRGDTEAITGLQLVCRAVAVRAP